VTDGLEPIHVKISFLKSSRMCSLHFHPGDFIEESTDNNAARKRQKLFHRYLKDGVVPSIFPSAPKYLSTNPACARETVSATTANRQEKDAHRIDLLQQSFFEADDITTLTAVEIMDSLKSDTALPFGFTFTVIESQLVIYWLQVRCSVPIIPGCNVVEEDHTEAISLEKTVDHLQNLTMC
jgi:hypothetical protein